MRLGYSRLLGQKAGLRGQSPLKKLEVLRGFLPFPPTDYCYDFKWPFKPNEAFLYSPRGASHSVAESIDAQGVIARFSRPLFNSTKPGTEICGLDDPSPEQ